MTIRSLCPREVTLNRYGMFVNCNASTAAGRGGSDPSGLLLTDRSITAITGLMARPREFDREEALECATGVFWAKGYASTSTDELLAAMGIGRQSLYNTFQDKRALYLEALERYQRTT